MIGSGGSGVSASNNDIVADRSKPSGGSLKQTRDRETATPGGKISFHAPAGGSAVTTTATTTVTTTEASVVDAANANISATSGIASQTDDVSIFEWMS